MKVDLIQDSKSTYKQAGSSQTDLPIREPEHVPPRRRRGGGFKRFVVIFLLILLGSSLLYVGYIVSIVAKISTNSWQIGPLAADPSGRTNVLLLGVGDPGHAAEKLSDTIMLVSLDGNSHRIAQLSIPRDLRVDIPGFGWSKINAANVYGGVALAEQTVSNTLDAQIDYYVETDFSGLKEIVNAVGGLDVMVKERLVDTEYPCDDNQYRSCGLHIEPGLQHMDGARALQYARSRKGTCGNDFGRAERQQELIGLLKPKVLDVKLLLNPGKLKILVAAVQKSVNTDLGLFQVMELANRVADRFFQSAGKSRAFHRSWRVFAGRPQWFE
jgi:LCP family protein required for cell wall assembly